MKILKRIFYTIFGLLMATTLALIGVILYAEYTGHRFSAGNHAADVASSDGESRLAYDENGNLAELPGSAAASSERMPQDSSGNGSPADSSASTPDGLANTSPETENPDGGAAGTDVSGSPESTSSPADSTVPADSTAVEPANANDGASPANPEDETERLYIMDTGSGLFHTDTCTDAAAIAVDQRSERTTTRTKVLDAGYQPCPNCNP